MDPFNAASQTFMTWLSSVGADINSKIQLQDLRNIHAGRGVSM